MTKRQKQQKAKKKYLKKKQSIKTQINKYTAQIKTATTIFKQEQMTMQEAIKSGKLGKSIHDLITNSDIKRNLEMAQSQLLYQQTIADISALPGSKTLIDKLQKLYKSLEVLNKVQKQTTHMVAPEAALLEINFSGIQFEAQRLKQDYITQLEKFEIIIAEFPEWTEIINTIRSMDEVEFFFRYNSLDQFTLDSLWETFGSDEKVLANGKEDSQAYQEAYASIDFNIRELKFRLSEDLTLTQREDLDQLLAYKQHRDDIMGTLFGMK